MYISSAIWTIVFITAITVYADLNLIFKDWLADAFGHHWIAKGLLAIVVFVAVRIFSGFGKKPAEGNGLEKGLYRLFYISMICSAVLLVFFLYEAGVFK